MSDTVKILCYCLLWRRARLQVRIGIDVTTVFPGRRSQDSSTVFNNGEVYTPL